MKKIVFGILSTMVLLNTACTPKEDDAPAATTMQSSSMNAYTSVAASSPVTAITPAAAPNTSSDELLNIYWKLVSLNGDEVTPVDNDREAHLVFNAENRVSGSDGCNRLMGSYLLDGNTLTFEQTAATRMACTEGAEQSQAFNKALTEAATYSVHGDQLEIRDASDLVIARFVAVEQP
jgi:heat shock protein HslJ